MASIWPVRINLQIVGAPSAQERKTDQVRDRVCARREREINPGNGERLHSFALHRRANCINVSLSRGGIAPRNSFQPRSKYVPSSSSSSSPRVWCAVPPKAFSTLALARVAHATSPPRQVRQQARSFRWNFDVSTNTSPLVDRVAAFVKAFQLTRNRISRPSRRFGNLNPPRNWIGGKIIGTI